MVDRARRHGRVAAAVVTLVMILSTHAHAAGPGASPPTVAVAQTCGSLDGRVVGTTVLGDLHVDESCIVLDTVVRGDVVVDPGVTLVLRLSTVHGDVVSSGSVVVERSSLQGGVRLERPTSDLIVRMSSIRRSIRGTAHTVHLVTSGVDGAVNLTLGGRLWIVEGAGVGGWVNTNGGTVEIIDTWLGRGLTATGGTGELRLCSVVIGETVTVQRSRGPVNVGVGPEGYTCYGYWRRDGVGIRGDLLLLDNAGVVRVSGATTGRRLECQGNDPLQMAVMGGGFSERTGQCA